MTTTLLIWGTIGGLIGAAVWTAMVMIYREIEDYLDSKELISKSYLQKETRRNQLLEDLKSIGIKTPEAKWTDDYNMVSQYYGNEDDTKLNINNL